MEWRMSQIYNATDEIAASAEYDNIRMFKVKKMTSDVEQEDLMQEDWTAWADPSDPNLESFSAVCFFYARSISDMIGRKVSSIEQSLCRGQVEMIIYSVFYIINCASASNSPTARQLGELAS